MKIPKRVTVCPIINSVVEIRFQTKSNINAIQVFGSVYGFLLKSGSKPKVENLAIMQLPDNIRTNDPSLRYKPWFKITVDDYSIFVGSDVFSISSTVPYKSWLSFFDQINTFFSYLLDSDVIESVVRIGVRYVNYFHKDITDDLTLTINFPSVNRVKNLTLSYQIEEGDFQNTVIFSNNAMIRNTVGEPEITQGEKNFEVGCILDIDSYKEFKGLKNVSKEQIIDYIDSAHETEKSIFFSLLTDSLIESLGPKYE